MKTVWFLVLLRSLLSKWVSSALIFWPSPMSYHWSSKFHFCLGPCLGSLESTLISLCIWWMRKGSGCNISVLIQDQGSMHSSRYSSPLTTSSMSLQCLDIEDDLLYGRGPLLSQWPVGVFPLELLNKPLRSCMPLGLKLCLLSPVLSPFLHPRSWDCWPMSPQLLASPRHLPYHSPSLITCQDHHLSPHPVHPLLHLPQPSPVLCNCFWKIILMSPPATSAITSNLSAIFTLGLFVYIKV